jgi:hypothetical protein
VKDREKQEFRKPDQYRATRRIEERYRYGRRKNEATLLHVTETRFTPGTNK